MSNNLIKILTAMN